MAKYDFSGWATRANLKCSDGRTIMNDAFKDNDGQTVPLVWNHQHESPYNVLGHALLENRGDGVYAYCSFNDTEQGRNAKLLVDNGDVSSLSIYANQLRQNGGNVVHGMIREVSLVLAGANVGAVIDNVVRHSDGASDDEAAIIYTGDEYHLEHAEEDEKKENSSMAEVAKAAPKEVETEKSEETVGEVFDTLTDKQKNVVYALIGQILEENGIDPDKSKVEDAEEGDDMKHNVFESDAQQGDFLSHSDEVAIFSDAKRYGSLKESALQHGVDNLDYLFPEDEELNKTPGFITREMGWVSKVMSAVHHTPFSRVKTTFADLREDEARALGYIKGNMKKDEVFSLLKRSTSPTTVYKKQKLDRDDVVDITDFDVVSWIKGEMRMMLDEEIARAILVGDGRLSSSDDKINEANIRPVYNDADLYTIKTQVDMTGLTTDDEKAKAVIRAAVKARKDYKGSGDPTFYTTEDQLTNMLLIEDTNGRVIYDSVAKLATAMRVKEIVTVPVMEGMTGSKGGSLLGIIVNLADYNVGADKGGAVSMFDDFDIDYNAQKYLIETRCSGALVKPYSAIALEVKA